MTSATTPIPAPPPAPAAPETGRRYAAWVRIAQRVWQRVGAPDTEAAALLLAADHLRQRHLSGDCFALPVDAKPTTPTPLMEVDR